jgi:fumarate reductase flavoprotein subunit
MTRKHVDEKKRSSVKAKAIAAAKPWLPKKWDYETDVIVVGAGAAGLMAAMQAHDAGVQVLVLEKENTPYSSSSAICGGSIAAAGTSLQKEQGIEDSPELFFTDVMKEAEYTNDEELLRLFAEHSRESIEWFRQRGLKFILRHYPGFTVDRTHYAGTGKGYMDIVVNEVKKRNISVLYNCSATRLIVDYSIGNVTGVAADKQGKSIFVRAKRSTILATGGFAGNKDKVDRFLIPFKGAIVGSSRAATGDGLLMGMKAGAGVTHLDYCAIYGCGFVTEPAARRGLLHRGYDLASVFGAIFVNKEGERFLKEETSPTLLAWKLRGQRDQTLYVLSDRIMWQEFVARPVLPVIGWTKERVLEEAEKQEYLIKKADSVEELGVKIGVDGARLRDTVRKYNTYVERGEDPEFGRDKEYLKRKIEVAPFYAMIGKPIVMVSVGGLKVNGRLQVLDAYLKPISGLYAAGEVVGGIHGTTFVGGAAFGSALCLARIAGKNAAAEPSSE